MLSESDGAPTPAPSDGAPTPAPSDAAPTPAPSVAAPSVAAPSVAAPAPTDAKADARAKRREKEAARKAALDAKRAARAARAAAKAAAPTPAPTQPTPTEQPSEPLEGYGELRSRILRNGPQWNEALRLLAMPVVRGVIAARLGVDISKIPATTQVISLRGSAELSATWDVCACRAIAELLAAYVDPGRAMEHPALISALSLGGLGLSLYGAALAAMTPQQPTPAPTPAATPAATPAPSDDISVRDEHGVEL